MSAIGTCVSDVVRRECEAECLEVWEALAGGGPVGDTDIVTGGGRAWQETDAAAQESAWPFTVETGSDAGALWECGAWEGEASCWTGLVEAQSQKTCQPPQCSSSTPRVSW